MLQQVPDRKPEDRPIPAREVESQESAADFLPNRPAMTSLAVDLYEEKDDLVAKIELPGIAERDIRIGIDRAVIVIEGTKKRKREEELKARRYHQMGRAYGRFYQLINLPTEVKREQVRSTCKDGVLEVRLPKAKTLVPAKNRKT